MSDPAARFLADGLSVLGAWICMGLIVHGMLGLWRRPHD